MTAEQFTAVLVAFASVLAGIAVIVRELRAYHLAVNSKMDLLLTLTEASALAKGREERRLGDSPSAGSVGKRLLSGAKSDKGSGPSGLVPRTRPRKAPRPNEE